MVFLFLSFDTASRLPSYCSKLESSSSQPVAAGSMAMADVERHLPMGEKPARSAPAPPAPELLVRAYRVRRRLRGCPCPSTRRALPAAAACVAAAVLAVAALSAAGGSPYMPLPLSFFFFQDAPPSNLTSDQLLGGLLTAEFGARSCRSRYEIAGYHGKTTASTHRPSPYLIRKLRKQEALQRRCGPGTAPYSAALRQLRSGDGAAATDCRYLVSVSYRGLGNRMLAIASAFLYALLTDRVLLVDRYNDVDALFCEPFPGTTWLLPGGWRFPLSHLRDYGINSTESLGNLLKSGALSVDDGGNATWAADGRRRPPYVYLHLDGDYGFHDKLFYCDEHQRLLHGAPWLLMKTDIYLVPSLFLVPSFRGELGEMFPEKDAAFYHLGKYLFHPTNAVWDLVTGYYRASLAGAGRRIGVQIRVFQEDQPPLQRVLDQVLSCVHDEKLLASDPSQAVRLLVTSLNPWYYERIKDELAGAGGKVAGVYQPSHEMRQKWGDTTHDMAALSEIYLLSMSDALVTSGFSTFGYVAQGLGGLRPWIMHRPSPWSKPTPEEQAAAAPPCRRAVSVEPCSHNPAYCPARGDVDVVKVVPYVQSCEDVSWGVKLVNGSSQW